MHSLPSPDKMAALVTGITETMLGLSFKPDSEAPRPSLSWRTAVLPIDGARPITVGLSSDEHGCGELSAAMFACPRKDVDQHMMNDSLCELVNMTAGLLKSLMSLDQALGLPMILDGDTPPLPPASSQTIVLKADHLGLVLWIYEGVGEARRSKER
jgi:hypothetical protein